MQIITAKDRCVNCDYCRAAISCPGEDNCTGCSACVKACPQTARYLIRSEDEVPSINCTIDGKKIQTSCRKTVLQVLEALGYSITFFPEKNSLFAPCRTGGCYSCAVLINGELLPSCITPIQEGMVIHTEIEEETSQRIVSGFQGHMVGGVGTPKNLITRRSYIEVACFASGCLFLCPTCQNWQITYLSRGKSLIPAQAAHHLTATRHRYKVDRMAISGGESTLNRKWLLEFVKSLKEYNPDEPARIHVDTNAAILTPDYIDELVEAGMTDIGPDLKGIRLETFMQITNIENKELAQKYLKTSWNAAKYVLDNYRDKVFLGVGVPYNSAFISIEEVQEIGDTLANWDPDLQVTVLDYRPEFRAQDLKRPTYMQMSQIKNLLNATGLKRVICQTTQGHIQ